METKYTIVESYEKAIPYDFIILYDVYEEQWNEEDDEYYERELLATFKEKKRALEFIQHLLKDNQEEAYTKSNPPFLS